jgi:adenosylcobinamide kinase/adenosylcobinamide-phosphate guanylyltransferase
MSEPRGPGRVPLVLLGTGPAGGLPVPGCLCRLCLRLGASGESRRPAAAVTGGVWLKAVPGVRLLGDVLWAPVAGLLGAEDVAALAGASARQVVLGPAPGRPVAEAALSLARLRGAGAVADDADVVLVGLTDRHPVPEARLLSAWGMRPAVDGERMGASSPVPVLPRRTLVLGGSASGKSALAEDLLAARPAVTYVATGPAPSGSDGEWAERVRAHRERRPPWWRTAETADAAGVLGSAPEPVLMDAVGTWLTGVLDRAGAWEGDAGWRAAVDGEVAALVDAWRARTGVAVAVSDEVGWGVVPETPAGRLFRAELGRVNRLLAAESEQVLLVVAGRVVELPDGGSS